MTEDERRTLVQVQMLAQASMDHKCRGICADCIARLVIINEKVTELLVGEDKTTEKNDG